MRDMTNIRYCFALPTTEPLPAPNARTPNRACPGDLWQLGQHRLLCGDCTDLGQVARLMQGDLAALTVTSPPYNLGKNAALASSRDIGSSKYLHGSDSKRTEDYLNLLCRFTENALAVSEVAVVNIQMLSGNKVAFVEYLHRFRHDLIDVAVWDKLCAPPAMARNVLTSRFEWLVFLTAHRSKGKTPRTIPTADFRGTVANVYQGPPRRGNPYFRLHAATFPLHLPTWLMETFDSKKGIVLDPFMGTGTTLIAAQQMGRRCYGMEIEPAYCDIALFRWEQMTGKLARRL